MIRDRTQGSNGDGFDKLRLFLSAAQSLYGLNVASRRVIVRAFVARLAPPAQALDHRPYFAGFAKASAVTPRHL